VSLLDIADSRTGSGEVDGKARTLHPMLVHTTVEVQERADEQDGSR
jgi:hypothetical protein